MSRLVQIGGPAIAVICGVLISYTAFRPELEKQREEREGRFAEQHTSEHDDRVISRAILSDLREARDQVVGSSETGFGWGIRQAIWGPRGEEQKGKNDDGRGEAGK